MCSDLRATPPAWSWIPEKKQDKEDAKLRLLEIQVYWRTANMIALRNAYLPGTLEFDYMKKLNDDIDAGQRQVPRRVAADKAGYIKRRTPLQEFKFDELYWTRGKSTVDGQVDKGGIDWFIYREQVLLKLIFPYYKKIQELNPGKKVWFVDDNVAIHSKAARSLENIMRR